MTEAEGGLSLPMCMQPYSNYAAFEFELQKINDTEFLTAAECQMHSSCVDLGRHLSTKRNR